MADGGCGPDQSPEREITGDAEIRLLTILRIWNGPSITRRSNQNTCLTGFSEFFFAICTFNVYVNWASLPDGACGPFTMRWKAGSVH